MVGFRADLTVVIVGALLGGAAIFGLDYRHVKEQLRAERKTTAELQAKLDHAAEIARLREKEFITNIDKLKDDLRRKNNLFESQRASNDVATDSLLKHIANLRSRIETSSADSARAVATRTGAVLGECAQEYSRVAAEAERLRIKIDGLQAVVRACAAVSAVAE